MPAADYHSHDKKWSVPFVLLTLSVLALVVSLAGLARTATLTGERLGELQTAWEAVRDGAVEGAELVKTDRIMSRLRVPVPAMRNAAYWSLGLAITSILLFIWLTLSMRRVRHLGPRWSNDIDGEPDYIEQAAIHKLMDEVAPLINGDLSVRATVNDAQTGTLARAFNYATSELRWLLGFIGHSGERVTSIIERFRRSSSEMSQACNEQSEDIHRSSNYLLAMSGAMAELSADAVESSTAAQAAAQQAAKASEALAFSMSRLASIREEAGVTTRLMHRLVDNVSVIDDRVNVIRDVARQTDLLALNTTIRASAGTRSVSLGDATADLGRLSDEVAQLAEVLGQATHDIGSLSRAIAKDASDTVKSMEFTTGELAAGVARTEQASEALQSILQESDALRRRVSGMAENILEQTGVVRQLSETMDSINRLTQLTDEILTSNTDTIGGLEELTDEMQQTLTEFKLPAKPAQKQRSTSAVEQRARETVDRTIPHG